MECISSEEYINAFFCWPLIWTTIWATNERSWIYKISHILIGALYSVSYLLTFRTYKVVSSVHLLKAACGNQGGGSQFPSILSADLNGPHDENSKKLVVESLFASGWTLQWVFLLLNQNSSQTSQELETSLLYCSTENAISLASQQGLILGHKARWHLLLFTQTCCLWERTFSAILSHTKMVEKLLHLI